jgi:hypothetical protein
MRPGVERTRQNVQELGATRAKDKRVKSITDTGRINMVKWMVIVERVEHISHVVDAESAHQAAKVIEGVGFHWRGWHRTLDTERIISVMPMEKSDEAK